jgi:hypothetical protein
LLQTVGFKVEKMVITVVDGGSLYVVGGLIVV